MSSDVQTLKKILQRFRFEEPISEKSQEAMRLRKKKVLIAVLHAASAYTVFDGIALSIYFALERNGVKISYRLSRGILWIIGAVALLLAMFILYFTLLPSPQIAPTTVDNVKIIQKRETKPVVVPKNDSKKEITPVKSFALIGVRTFSSDDETKAFARNVEKNIIIELNTNLGDGKAVWYDEEKSRVLYFLSGSIISVEGELWCNIRMVNIETAQVLFTASAKGHSPEELLIESRKIASRLAGIIKRD